MHKKMFLLILVIVVLFIGCKKEKSKLEEKVVGIKFYTSLAQAKKIAKKQQKPIMIDLYTDWCSWCKVLDEKTYSDPKVGEYVSKKLVALKIDSDKEPYLAKKFNITGYPTILFIDSDENEVDRLVGFYKPEQYLEKLKDFFDKGNTFKNLEETYQTKKDIESAKKYIEALDKRGMYDEVLEISSFILQNDPNDTATITIRFQTLFGSGKIKEEKYKNEFLALSKTIEKEADTRYKKYKISYFYIMFSYHLQEKDIQTALKIGNDMLSMKEVKENPRLTLRLKLSILNTYIEIGNLKMTKKWTGEIDEKYLIKNFKPWLKTITDKNYLNNLNKFERSAGDFLREIEKAYNEKKDIASDTTKIEIPNDPITDKKLLYTCKLNEKKQPAILIIETPNPEKYKAKRLYFDITKNNFILNIEEEKTTETK